MDPINLEDQVNRLVGMIEQPKGSLIREPVETLAVLRSAISAENLPPQAFNAAMTIVMQGFDALERFRTERGGPEAGDDAGQMEGADTESVSRDTPDARAVDSIRG